jgi:outer membrane protein assembly factor BamB
VYVGVSSPYLAVQGGIQALAMSDGSLLARQHFVPAGERGADIWNSPTLATEEGLLFVATGNDFGGFDGPFTRAMVALHPETLAILAAHQEALPERDLDFGTTPIVFHDDRGRTLVGANQKNRTFFAYDVDRLGDGPVWQRPTGLSVGAMPAYDPDLGPGGTLFIVGGSSLLYAVDPATGADRWGPVVVGTPNGNMALANGLVFIGGGNGHVLVIDGRTGTLLRAIVPESPGPTYSGIVVAGGTLYWMSGPYLNAWKLPSPAGG